MNHNATPLSPLIHLIDDDEAVRNSLALLIGTIGLRVQPWADPQAFVRDFDRQSIGAIVMDVRMPGTSGLACSPGMAQSICVGGRSSRGHSSFWKSR